MPIETGFYSNLRPVETPDFAEAKQKGMSIAQLAMQNEHLSKQMSAEDKEAQYKDHLRKASAFGEAMDSLSGLSPEERATAYPQVRSELLQSGIIGHDQLPEEYHEGLYRQNLTRYQQSKDYLDKALQRAQIDHLRAESKKDKQGADKSIELASNLRKEWTGLHTTKTTQDVAQSIERFRKAAEDPSAAGDMAMIYSFMKLNDPGSTVREGEFANAQNAAGVPEQIRARWNALQNGERLSTAQRADFSNQAEKMYAGQLIAQKTADQQYSSLAERYGVDPSVIMMKFPDPREIQQVAKQEEEKPGFFASLFGLAPKSAAAAETKSTEPKQTQKIGSGAIVEVNGKQYRVGADGDSLEPIQPGKR